MDGHKQTLVQEVKAMTDALSVGYHPGELIYQAGAFAAGIHLVESGLVMLGVYSSGEARPVGLSAPGDLLGVEAWRSNGTPQHSGFARALTKAEVLFAPTESWSEALADESLRSLVLSQLAEAVLDWQSMALRRNEPEYTLAWVLLRWGVEQDGMRALPVSLTLLADLLAISRHTMRQVVSQLEERQVVVAQPGAIVGDPSRLLEFLERELTASPG
ncbi:MAG: Crp/Fnr family transcriptional regulator [Candidatus Bipolaricaulota bacterium]